VRCLVSEIGSDEVVVKSRGERSSKTMGFAGTNVGVNAELPA